MISAAHQGWVVPKAILDTLSMTAHEQLQRSDLNVSTSTVAEIPTSPFYHGFTDEQLRRLRVMSEPDYRADSTAVSRSALYRILRSPAHYHAYTRGDCYVETADTDLGVKFHMATLEPDRFSSHFAKWSGRRQGAEYKRFLQGASARGQSVISGALAEKVQAMAKATRAYRHENLGDFCLGDYLDGCLAERVIEWTDQETGIRLKIRWDAGCSAFLLDLKKTKDCRPEAFQRQIYTYGYHFQAAMYLDGFKAVTGESVPFYLVAAEDTAPYCVWIHEIGGRMLEEGREQYRAALRLLKECRERNEWPAYPGAWSVAQSPRW